MENADELVAAIKTDYRQAPLDPVDRGILDFARKLTLTPAEMSAADVDGLRRLGLDDATVHDVVQVTALFNYYDRLADGLGIDPEPEFSR
jgi:uncharacterized peroxidase-related enzyme